MESDGWMAERDSLQGSSDLTAAAKKMESDGWGAPKERLPSATSAAVAGATSGANAGYGDLRNPRWDWSWQPPLYDDSFSKAGPVLRYRVEVINLDSQQDRLANFVQAMERGPGRVLLPHKCRFPAVDGHNPDMMQTLVGDHLVSQATFMRAERAYVPGDITQGMIGCYASHWSAMRRIAADDSLDFGLIAEDDLVHYSDDFEEQFKKLWDNSKGEAASFWETADIVFLQYDDSARGWAKGGQRNPTMKTKLQYISPRSQPRNNGLYAVSRAAARRMAGVAGDPYRLGRLVGRFGIRHQLDDVMPSAFPEMRVWRFEPPIAQTLSKDEPGGSSSVQVQDAMLQESSQPVMPECPHARFDNLL